MGGGISKNATWIRRCTRTIGVQACCENIHVKRSLLGFRVNLLVANGRYCEAESPLSTAAAIPSSELTLPCISWLINAIAGSMSRIRTPAVKSSTIGVERPKALAINAKDRDRSKDYGKDKDRNRHKGTVRDTRSSQPLQRESGRS